MAFVSPTGWKPRRNPVRTGRRSLQVARLTRQCPHWEPSFLETLKARGYFTGGFQKVHQRVEFENPKFETFYGRLPAGKPFFPHVGFTDPHQPYKGRGHATARSREGASPRFLRDSKEVREDLVMYPYFIISRLDAECGRLLALLEAQREHLTKTMPALADRIDEMRLSKLRSQVEAMPE